MSYDEPLSVSQLKVLERFDSDSSHYYPAIDRATGQIVEVTRSHQDNLDRLEFEGFLASGIGYGLSPQPGPLLRYYTRTDLGYQKTLDAVGFIPPACPRCGAATERHGHNLKCSKCEFFEHMPI